MERPASAEGGSVRPEDGKAIGLQWGLGHICPEDVVFPSVATPNFDLMFNFYVAKVRVEDSYLQIILYFSKDSKQFSNLGALKFQKP